MKNKKKKEIQRRVAGISFGQASRVAPPHCHLVYEVWWSDGSTSFERGRTLFGATFQIDEGGEVPKNNRMDLYSKIVAAGLLANDLEQECAQLDGVKL
jgi:hypothetical protein